MILFLTRAAAVAIAIVVTMQAVRLDAQPLDSKTSTLGEWPQLLGPQRNGRSSETGLLDRWPQGGPKEIWRVPGGVGMSGVSISRGRALTLVQREGKQWLIALDANTGKSQWQTELAPEFRNPMGNGPRATPTIAGEEVFVFTGEGIINRRSVAFFLVGHLKTFAG